MWLLLPANRLFLCPALRGDRTRRDGAGLECFCLGRPSVEELDREQLRFSKTGWCWNVSLMPGQKLDTELVTVASEQTVLGLPAQRETGKRSGSVTWVPCRAVACEVGGVVCVRAYRV
jgi:hypothetical protein